MKTCQNKSLLIIRTVVMFAIVVTSLGCTGTIGIQAEYKVFEKDGPRPLYKQEIYLLRNSITSEEMEEAFKKYMASPTPPVEPGTPLAEKNVRTRARFMFNEGGAIWHRYIIERVNTDHKGQAKFRSLAPGDYWLYAITRRSSDEYVIWNVKTTVKFYERTDVKLNDQNSLKEAPTVLTRR
jgi:hypothetical protein